MTAESDHASVGGAILVLPVVRPGAVVIARGGLDKRGGCWMPVWRERHEPLVHIVLDAIEAALEPHFEPDLGLDQGPLLGEEEALPVLNLVRGVQAGEEQGVVEGGLAI